MVGEESPHVMALSALVVGAFSSTREIARLLGEPEFKIMFQQGNRLNIFISLLDSQDLITVIFDERTTLGMIKLKTQQMTKRISEEIKNMAQSQVGQGGPWR
jgi:predicted regulator of Ras-like GTPase activity (Roadblock/LC7/MglB family)